MTIGRRGSVLVAADRHAGTGVSSGYHGLTVTAPSAAVKAVLAPALTWGFDSPSRTAVACLPLIGADRTVEVSKSHLRVGA